MTADLCRELLAPWRGGELFVGFSGGADSTAALLITHDFQAEFGYRLIAVHFNHHLRGSESDAEAAAAARFAAELGVDFMICDLDMATAAGSGVEDTARRLRLEQWRRLTAGKERAAVVLGHHAGDAAENLLIRVFRGSNSSALAGMRSCSRVGGVTILRPLLNFSRCEIEAWLVSRGVQAWQHDSSNHSVDYLRNYLRNEVIPEICSRFPGGEAGIGRTLEALRLDADCLDGAAVERCANGDPGRSEFWRQLPPALFVRSMRLCFRGDGGAPFSGGEIAEFRRAVELDRPEPYRVVFSGGPRLFIQRGVISREEAEPPERLWRWREEPELIWGGWRLTRRFVTDFSPPAGPDGAVFDADLLPEAVVVGAPFPGESMVPFGRVHAEKIKKLRVDRGVTAWPPHPIVRTVSGEVVWAAGIRHSGVAPVGENTRRMVEFSLSPAER